MIQCSPTGICSWDFILDGEGHWGELEFNWVGEQGRLTADGTLYVIHKQGVFSGQWTLDRAGQSVASAQKSNVFTRTIDLQYQGGMMVVRAQSPFGRSFLIERAGDPVAEVAPLHPFTRRARIETRDRDYDFAMVSFAFWLVVLMWRRAAQSD